MIVVNMFGGPGCGKSTTAAGVFSKLKQKGIVCEYVHEWVKWPVWEKRTPIFDDQLYIFAKQHHMLHSIKDSVDVAITDSPLLLSNIYGKLYSSSAVANHPSFFELVDSVFDSFDNLNIMLERKKTYSNIGRVQTEEEARGVDQLVVNYLNDTARAYQVAPGNAWGITKVVDFVMSELEPEK